MVSSKACWKKWGDPTTTADEGKYMVLWDVPNCLEIGVIPKKLYCNKLMIEPLTESFNNLASRGFVSELKTFDGCFNVRPIRGYETHVKYYIKKGDIEHAAQYFSLHCWGVAIDVNAAWNGLGKEPKLSAGFVKCFTDAGFDWGGDFTRKDGMHFQLKNI